VRRRGRGGGDYWPVCCCCSEHRPQPPNPDKTTRLRSYLLRPGGRLTPVPAGKSDIFTDKELTVGAKRVLMKFLKGCLEAEAGEGPLKVRRPTHLHMGCSVLEGHFPVSMCSLVSLQSASNQPTNTTNATNATSSTPPQGAFDSRPLIDLLAAQGLDAALRGVVVHGIAMCDAAQLEPAHADNAAAVAAAAASGSGDGAAAALHGAGAEATTSSSAAATSSSGNTSSRASALTAAAGLRALRLYTESLGRYGGRGAFMAPCYGSGAILEAFVRLAAVKGAVSVLRMGAPGLVVDDDKGGGGCRGVALTNGQVIAAGCVVGGPEFAAACGAAGCGALVSSSSGGGGGSGSGSDPVLLARAVCLLDGPLVEGDSSLLFVAPPPGPAGNSGGHNSSSCVVRGLQVGSALQVAPAGKFLLYLTAEYPSDPQGRGQAHGVDAEALLRPALDALAGTGELRPLLDGDEESGGSSGGRAGAGGEEAAGSPDEGAAARQRPKVLAAAFYTQRLQPAPPAGAASAGSTLIACPGPDGGLVGYGPALEAAEALFRRHFPALPWLTDPPPPGKPAGGEDGEQRDGDDSAEGTSGGETGGGEAAAAAAAGGGDYGEEDEEDSAIDELQAALLELGMGLPEEEAPGGGGAPTGRGGGS
jgi:hypothetical protein